MADRDQMLATFQAITAIDDIDECIALLQQHDWNLEDAAQTAMAMQEADAQPPPSNPNVAFNIPPEQPPPDYSMVTPPEPFPIPQPGPSVSAPPLFSAQGSAFSRVIGHTNANHQTRLLDFSIEYRERNIVLKVPDCETVGKIKELLSQEVGVLPGRQMLRGWVTKSDRSISDEDVLQDLKLPRENHLFLLVPDIGDMSVIQATNGEDNSLLERLSQTYILNIHYTDKDRTYKLNFPGNRTVQEVKGDVYSLIDVPVRHQVWAGWPDAAADETMTLAGAGVDTCHCLQVSSNKPPHGMIRTATTSHNRDQIPAEIIAVSSDDDDFADAEDFDVDDDAVMFDSPSSSRKQQLLMPANARDQTAALEQFMSEFVSRYGECHPCFFIGTLDDAIREALQVRARDRKLLAIYLHHDCSIQANVFCSQVLCSESIVSYLSNNFITWAWDLTSQANKAKLMTMCTHHFGSVAASKLRDFKEHELPTLLVISRSRGSNEVATVIPGNSTVDEVMTLLINSVEVFQEQASREIEEEDARDARERMKMEQDEAYQESLKADRAKAEAKRIKEEEQRRVEEEAERKKQAEEDERRRDEIAKEARARLLAKQLPEEPPAECTERVSTIKIRAPEGVVLTRRFMAANPLQVILNFIASKGYHTTDYKVLTTYPRRDLTTEDLMKSLEELKLYPQETLILEEK